MPHARPRRVRSAVACGAAALLLGSPLAPAALANEQPRAESGSPQLQYGLPVQDTGAARPTGERPSTRLGESPADRDETTPRDGDTLPDSVTDGSLPEIAQLPNDGLLDLPPLPLESELGEDDEGFPTLGDTVALGIAGLVLVTGAAGLFVVARQPSSAPAPTTK